MSHVRHMKIELPENSNAVILEYIAPDHTRTNFITKTYVVDFEPKAPEDCPVRHFSQFVPAEIENSCPDVALQPVVMFRDPFRKGPHKIVLCEIQSYDGKLKAINSRAQCRKFMERFEQEEPWIGFEQEFFFVDSEGIPCDYDIYLMDPNTDFSDSMFKGKNVAVEREIVESHLMACLYAGIRMYGYTREENPSEWEYQTAPLPVVDACDELQVSRYILSRLAEMYGLGMSFFNPKCIRETYSRMTLQPNFSTRKMREDGGIRYIREALENISIHDQEMILKYYDLVEGNDYKWRVAGTPFSSRYDKLVIRVGDKWDSSLTIPSQVDKIGKGYFEDRRPSGEADPYDVSRILTAAVFLNKTNFIRLIESEVNT